MSLLILLAAASPLETRCGWLHNPTPGNWWLTDRDREWTLSTQGGPAAPGWDTLDSTGSSQWVRTNGYYGYGCACARMRVDRARGTVVEISRLTRRSLNACRSDRRLPKP